jgi:hypothetical protein
MSSEQDGWTRYYDESNSAYYWYNSITEESVWEDEVYDQSRTRNDDQRSLLVHPPTVPTGYDNDQILRNVEQSFSQVPGESSNSELQFVWYRRLLFCNALIVEAPACVVEAFLRSVLLSCFGFCLLLMSVVFRRGEDYRPLLLKISRDITLTLMAGLSFCVPGMILYVYKDFSSVDDWNLSLLPTVLGPVDCRRFIVLTLFGYASLAKNLSDSSPSTEVWPDSITFLPREVFASICSVIQERLIHEVGR